MLVVIHYIIIIISESTATSPKQTVALLDCENFFMPQCSLLLWAAYYYFHIYFSHLLFGLHFSLLVCMKKNKTFLQLYFQISSKKLCHLIIVKCNVFHVEWLCSKRCNMKYIMPKKVSIIFWIICLFTILLSNRMCESSNNEFVNCMS